MRGTHKHIAVTCIQLIISVLYRLATLSTYGAIIQKWTLSHQHCHEICEKEELDARHESRPIFARMTASRMAGEPIVINEEKSRTLTDINHFSGTNFCFGNPRMR